MRKLQDWIEYMEGEGDPQLMCRLRLLLKHSIPDQVVLENLRRLRKKLKESDPALEIEAELKNTKFLKALHKKTMSCINGSQKKRLKPRAETLVPDEDQRSSLAFCKR